MRDFFVRQGEKRKNSSAILSIFNEVGRKRNRFDGVPDLISVYLKHDNGQGAPAEVIPGKVVEAQSLQVDTVSGATHSSLVILKAIENALVWAGELERSERDLLKVRVSINSRHMRSAFGRRALSLLYFS